MISKEDGLAFWPEHDVPETVSAERQDEENCRLPGTDRPMKLNVDLKVLDNESEASALHKLGVRKLTHTSTKGTYKSFKKNTPTI